MKKLLLLFVATALYGVSLAQYNHSQSLAISVDNDSRIDQLLELKAELAKSNKSTKEADLQLAWYGVKYPARVSIAQLNGRTNVSFQILEDGSSSLIAGKVSRLKKKMAELEYLGIDSSRSLCNAMFDSAPTEKQLEKLVSEFLYDGYYLVTPEQVELGALDR